MSSAFMDGDEATSRGPSYRSISTVTHAVTDGLSEGLQNLTGDPHGYATNPTGNITITTTTTTTTNNNATLDYPNIWGNTSFTELQNLSSGTYDADLHGNWTPGNHSWTEWITDIRIPFYIIILVLAVVGNTLVILTLAQNKRMRTVTNVFLLNLSISDLLLAIFCMPFTLIPSVMRDFIFGETVCVLIRYLQGVSVSVSCFTLVAISLERYFAICRPLHSRTWQTVTHAYISIAICWGMSAVVTIPIATYTTLRPIRHIHKCTEEWPNQMGEQIYTTVLDFVLLLIPIFIMSIAYGMVCHTLWKGIHMDARLEKEMINRRPATDETDIIITSGRSGASNAPNARLFTKSKFDYCGGIRQSNIEKSRAAKLRVIRMLFVIVLEFFVCWCPLYFVQTWVAFDRAAVNRSLSSTSNSFIQLLAYVSSCCNPITYCFMNRKFRQGFLSAFRCCRVFQPGLVRRSGTSMSGYNASTRTATSRILIYDKLQLTAGPER